MHEAMLTLTKAIKTLFAEPRRESIITSLRLRLDSVNTAVSSEIGPLLFDAIDGGLLKDLDLAVLDENTPYFPYSSVLKRAQEVDGFLRAYPSVLHCLTRLSFSRLRFSPLDMNRTCPLFEHCKPLEHRHMGPLKDPLKALLGGPDIKNRHQRHAKVSLRAILCPAPPIGYLYLEALLWMSDIVSAMALTALARPPYTRRASPNSHSSTLPPPALKSSLHFSNPRLAHAAATSSPIATMPPMGAGLSKPKGHKAPSASQPKKREPQELSFTAPLSQEQLRHAASHLRQVRRVKAKDKSADLSSPNDNANAAENLVAMSQSSQSGQSGFAGSPSAPAFFDSSSGYPSQSTRFSPQRVAAGSERRAVVQRIAGVAADTFDETRRECFPRPFLRLPCECYL